MLSPGESWVGRAPGATVRLLVPPPARPLRALLPNRHSPCGSRPQRIVTEFCADAIHRAREFRSRSRSGASPATPGTSNMVSCSAARAAVRFDSETPTRRAGAPCFARNLPSSVTAGSVTPRSDSTGSFIVSPAECVAKSFVRSFTVTVRAASPSPRRSAATFAARWRSSERRRAGSAMSRSNVSSRLICRERSRASIAVPLSPRTRSWSHAAVVAPTHRSSVAREWARVSRAVTSPTARSRS